MEANMASHCCAKLADPVNRVCNWVGGGSETTLMGAIVNDRNPVLN
jgi:hypothetical protein